MLAAYAAPQKRDLDAEELAALNRADERAAAQARLAQRPPSRLMIALLLRGYTSLSGER